MSCSLVDSRIKWWHFVHLDLMLVKICREKEESIMCQTNMKQTHGPCLVVLWTPGWNGDTLWTSICNLMNIPIGKNIMETKTNDRLSIDRMNYIISSNPRQNLDKNWTWNTTCSIYDINSIYNIITKIKRFFLKSSKWWSGEHVPCPT